MAKGGGKGKMGGKQGKMMQMMQMMMQAWGGGEGGGEAGTAGGNSNQGNWKGTFIGAYQRTNKGSSGKDEVVYEVSEVEGEGRSGYQCSLTIQGGDTYTGEVSASKKGAEHEAAKVACQEMFPEDFKKASQGDMMSSMMSSMGKGKGGGKKRPAEDQLGPKSRLNHVLPLIFDRGAEKGDLTFTVEETGEGHCDDKYTATCTLKPLDKVFTGAPKKSKRDAEDAAAEAALAGLKDLIEPAEAEHKAKKAKKNKESIAALKVRTDAKKAEKAEKTGKAEGEAEVKEE